MWCSDHLMYGLIFIAEPIRLFDIPDCRLVRKPVVCFVLSVGFCI